MLKTNAVWELQSEISKLDPRIPCDPRLMAFTDVSSVRYQEAIYNVQHDVMFPYEAACTYIGKHDHTNP
jgi:hypothetical protein